MTKYDFLERALENAIKISFTGKVKLYDILKKDINVYADDTFVGLELLGREDNHIVKFNSTDILSSSGFGAFKEGLKFVAMDNSTTTRRMLEIVKGKEYLVEFTTEKIDDNIHQTDIVLLDTLDGYGNKFKISILKNSKIKGEM